MSETLCIFPRCILIFIGKFLGFLSFYICKKYRNISLLNLCMAFPENTFKKNKSISKKVFINLGITAIETICIKKLNNQINKIIVIDSVKEYLDIINLLEHKKGVIFFTGHQANWEIPFTFLSKKYNGIAIAKRLSNPFLNKWIKSLREGHLGKVVYPVSAISNIIKEIHDGRFVGIVGDQAVSSSSYSTTFFGHKALCSTSPAILAHKSKCAIYGVYVLRRGNKYHISLSPQITPNNDTTIKKDIINITDTLFQKLEISIRKHPEQWMWIHNRWKTKADSTIKKQYRFPALLIILDEIIKEEELSATYTLQKLFPNAQIVVLTNSRNKSLFDQIGHNIVSKYDTNGKISNYFHAVFNFSKDQTINTYYRQTGSLFIFTKKSLSKHNPNKTLSESMNFLLVKPCLITDFIL